MNEERVHVGFPSASSVVGSGDHVVYVPNGADQPVLVVGEPQSAVGHIGRVVGKSHDGLVDTLIHAGGLPSHPSGPVPVATGRAHLGLGAEIAERGRGGSVTQRTPWGAYKTITDALRARITAGEFAPGAALPC